MLSISFYDKSTLITARVSIRIESQINNAVIAAQILRVSHEENIDIMLEWDFGLTPKIGNNLKLMIFF